MSAIKRNVYSIVVIGDSQVGKTCMIHKLCYGCIPIDYEPTIEDLHTAIVLTEKLEITETTIDDLAKPLRRESLKRADAVLFVYDSQNAKSTDNLFWYLEELREAHQWKSFRSLPTVCIVVGLAKHVGPVDQSALSNAKSFAEHWGLEHVNARLKSVSVQTVFEKCVFMIEERRDQLAGINVQLQHDSSKCCEIM